MLQITFYYIDLDKEYALVRLNTSTKTLEQLFSAPDAKVINYNRYGSKIFFQLEGGEQLGLYRINTDGTQLEFIAEGNIASIYCTSQYTFSNIMRIRYPCTEYLLQE